MGMQPGTGALGSWNSHGCGTWQGGQYRYSPASGPYSNSDCTN